MEEISFNKYDDYDGDIGESEYSSKSDFSKGRLVYDCFMECTKSRSVEMRSGYFNTTISKAGTPIKTWIGDTRKKYWSSVQSLRRILAPEILEANDKDEIKKIIEEMNNLFKTYAYTEMKAVIINNKKRYISTDRRYLPEIESSVKIIKEYGDGSQIIEPVIGGWDLYINAYWDEMVILSDRLLEELMKIIHNGNYFKSKTRFG